MRCPRQTELSTDPLIGETWIIEHRVQSPEYSLAMVSITRITNHRYLFDLFRFFST